MYVNWFQVRVGNQSNFQSAEITGGVVSKIGLCLPKNMGNGKGF